MEQAREARGELGVDYMWMAEKAEVLGAIEGPETTAFERGNYHRALSANPGTQRR